MYTSTSFVGPVVEATRQAVVLLWMPWAVAGTLGLLAFCWGGWKALQDWKGRE